MAQRVPTMLGRNLSVAVARCNAVVSMTVDGVARVTEQDLAASDGVVQVTDAVILTSADPEDDAVADAGALSLVATIKTRFAADVQSQP